MKIHDVATGSAALFMTPEVVVQQENIWNRILCKRSIFLAFSFVGEEKCCLHHLLYLYIDDMYLLSLYLQDFVKCDQSYLGDNWEFLHFYDFSAGY